MIKVNIDDDNLEYAGIDAGGGNMWNYNGEPFTGLIEEFNNSGILIGETECIDGFTDGRQASYYNNGQIEMEHYEKYNRFYGNSKKWDQNGNLIRHLVYDSSGNIIQRIIG